MEMRNNKNADDNSIICVRVSFLFVAAATETQRLVALVFLAFYF
jgi:hypothetical protein